MRSVEGYMRTACDFGDFLACGDYFTLEERFYWIDKRPRDIIVGRRVVPHGGPMETSIYCEIAYGGRTLPNRGSHAPVSASDVMPKFIDYDM